MPKLRHNPQLILSLISLITLISLTLNIIFIFQNYQRNRVTRVVDGDSLDLADGRRIRLLGLDAPERGECMSLEAYERLKELALNRHVRLKNTVKDDYGRLLANVIIEEPYSWFRYLLRKGKTFLGLEVGTFPDPMLNRALVSEGLARFNSVNTEYKDILKQAQEKAKTEKIGIWSELCRMVNPVSDCKIKGNIRAGKKTYFLPDCANYSEVIIDTSFGDRWFCTEDEAISAQFTIASGCDLDNR